MGTIASRDTRRISFNNNFALGTELNIQKGIEMEDAIALDNLTTEPSPQLLFSENYSEPGEEIEGDYWTRRIDYLKKEHQQINKIMEFEYDKTIGTTNYRYEVPKSAREKMQKIKPCIDWRTKILKCYQDNSHQPLVCSSAVEAFANYVSNFRLED